MVCNKRYCGVWLQSTDSRLCTAPQLCKTCSNYLGMQQLTNCNQIINLRSDQISWKSVIYDQLSTRQLVFYIYPKCIDKNLPMRKEDTYLLRSCSHQNLNCCQIEGFGQYCNHGTEPSLNKHFHASYIIFWIQFHREKSDGIHRKLQA